jgi:hypothetical protein
MDSNTGEKAKEKDKEKKAPEAPTASARPTSSDLNALRAAVRKAHTTGAAVDGAVAWIANILAAHPNNQGGARVTACARLQKPAGTLKLSKTLVGTDPKEMKVVVERTALASRSEDSEGGSGLQDDGPIQKAFQRFDARLRAVALAPVASGDGLWGTLCVGLEPPDAEADLIRRTLEAAARALEDLLKSKGAWLAKSVAEDAPRTPLRAEGFLREAAALLTAMPSEGAILGIVVYQCAVPIGDPSSMRRLTNTVAARALRAIRTGDLAAVVGDDTVAFALAGGDAKICGVVLERIRAQLSKLSPEAALGGFAHEVIDEAEELTPELLDRLRETARGRVLLKS